MTEIEPGRVRFHRNGVSGEGFYTVEFRMRRLRHAWHPMVGVVFDGPGRCAVIDLADPATTWRGDQFEDDLRAAIGVADQTREAYTA